MSLIFFCNELSVIKKKSYLKKVIILTNTNDVFVFGSKLDLEEQRIGHSKQSIMTKNYKGKNNS